MENYKRYKETYPHKTDAQIIESLVWELKDKVETIHRLLAENEALRIHDVSGRSEQLVCDECGDTGRAYPTLSEPDGVECEKCNHKFERVEKGGEFQGNQCDCGEWEDLT